MKRMIPTVCMVLRGVFNACWKIAIVVIAVCIVSAVLNEYGLGYARICRFLAPKWECANTLSDNVYVQQHKKGYYKLFDRYTDRKLSNTRFRMVYDAPERDSLTVFCMMDGKRGFLNVNTGQIVIPAKYRHAWVFSEGVAAVVGDDDSLRFIGYDGKPVFNRAFEYDTDYDYVFRDGVCIVTRQTDEGCRMGMIDLTGKWILLPEYQSIEFSGCDSTLYLTKDYVKFHAKSDGTVLEPFVVDNVRVLEYDVPEEAAFVNDDYSYSGGIISDRVASYQANDLYGLLDLRTGKPLTPACFSGIYMLTANLVRCQLEGTYSEVLYDSNGRRIQ